MYLKKGADVAHAQISNLSTILCKYVDGIIVLPNPITNIIMA